MSRATPPGLRSLVKLCTSEYPGSETGGWFASILVSESASISGSLCNLVKKDSIWLKLVFIEQIFQCMRRACFLRGVLCKRVLNFWLVTDLHLLIRGNIDLMSFAGFFDAVGCRLGNASI